MKKYTTIFSAFAILALVSYYVLGFHTASTFAAVNNWQKGASIYPRWDSDFGSDSFKQSISNLKATNANYVTLIIPWYQSNPWSLDLQRGGNTPTDDSVVKGIQYAHSLGMAVMLKPHVDLWDGMWRANINPGDRDAWYAKYTDMIVHYAQIAKDNGVEQLCIGTELIGVASSNANPDNTARWNKIIDAIKAVYSGKLTYSANWGGTSEFLNEKRYIGFWARLDFIGLAGYFELGSDWNNNVDHLKQQWNAWNVLEISPLQQQYGKPVLFTEVGYRSVGGAHTRPWDYSFQSYSDETEQANDYEALFSYWNDYPWMSGVHLWDWNSDPNAGWPGNTEYTPQHKQAEEVMKRWFGGSVVTTGSPIFRINSTSINPANPTAGQNITVNTNITNTGENARSNVVDIEIFDQSNNRVLQKFFDGQEFTANQTRNYSVDFTPNNGSYTVAVGVFNNNWSRNYIWEGNALRFNVGSSPTPSPTPTITTTPSPTPPSTPSPTPTTAGSYDTDVWWPASDAHVSGIQPFKAMLKNIAVSAYKMFWQVDGDRLNPMYDSSEGYPHKEAIVDLSGWNWKNTGIYNINFLSKDLGGNTISQKSVDIFVNH
jgi:hypothetical protein